VNKIAHLGDHRVPFQRTLTRIVVGCWPGHNGEGALYCGRHHLSFRTAPGPQGQPVAMTIDRGPTVIDAPACSGGEASGAASSCVVSARTVQVPEGEPGTVNGSGFQ